MKTIYLDTNFLLIPYTLKVDIFSEIKRIMDEPYEICILNETLDELKNIINKQKSKYKQAARMALQLVEKKKIKQKSLKMIADSKAVDDILVDISDKNTLIATQDRVLKKRLSEKGISVIVLRKKQYLEKNVL